MVRVSGYSLLEKLSENRNFIVYHGQKEGGAQTFIIRILKSPLPSPADAARFKREYSLIKALDAKGVVKILDIVPCGSSYAVVEEDFDGIPLRTLIKTAPFDLSSFLQIARQLAEVLGILHWNQIIHMEIKPDNILINQSENRIKITNFGISAIFTHTCDTLYNNMISGTLAYMSPEQTGRMNRSVDYRTDLYSLGITFYEMLTGIVPFWSDDPLELIHSHIARKPRAPDAVNPAVPRVVSGIILKLLAKTPEERYQNSMGLMKDIGECIQRLNTHGVIDDFPLAVEDISIRFNIPQIIVGRDKDKDKLIKVFERAAGGASEILLVQGAPGIGKSGLVNEIHKPVVARRGYFISGKYDQFRKDVPYSALIQAFQGLIRQLLAENEKQIAVWKEKLLSALGPNGKVITGVIPELELIIGSQPEIPELAPQETQNRFKLVFLNFIKVFTAREHPLALFLDDLQWADMGSLNLIKAILTGLKMKFLCLIGTCRDSEMTPGYPLALALEEIRREGTNINFITLEPLTVRDINSIISETLKCTEEKSEPIALLIHEKTAGNPFFIIQFLKRLYDNKIIKLHPRTGWSWDVEEIKDLQVTDNVVEFLAEKINNLPPDVQDILKIGACIGNRFDLETLSFALEKTIDDVLSDLAVAIQEHLVSSFGDIYKFHHDRIQEAAYSLLSENKKAEMHYRIGSNALEKTSETLLPEKIFYIVDQLNRGMAQVKVHNRHMRLAELNLLAGEKAIRSSAYVSALVYLKAGTELLPENSWEKSYLLTCSLYLKRMLCEYLTRNFSGATDIFHMVIRNTKNKIDKVSACTIMMSLYTQQGNYRDAIKLGREGLRILGFRFPEKVTSWMIAGRALKLYLQFGRRKIEDILTLPFTADRAVLAYLDLLTQLGETTYYVNTNLFSYEILEAASTVIKHGLQKDAANVFIGLAIIIGPVIGFYKQGYRFGEMALKLNERTKNAKNFAEAWFLFGSFLLHWKKHIKYSIDLFREAFKGFYEVGNLFFTAHCINMLFINRWIAGDNIDEILEEYENQHDFLISCKNAQALITYAENIQVYRCHKGLTEKRGSLNSGDFREEKQAQCYKAEGLELPNYFFSILRIKIRYLFGIYEECLPLIRKINKLNKKKIDVGSAHYAEANFYSSLVIAAVYKGAGVRQRMKYRKQLLHNQKRMKLWSELCPENFLHKYLFVKAEWARIRMKYRRAENLYRAAIQSAHDNRYTQNEGIADERAALFMLELGNREGASVYMKAARLCYVMWGASDKVKQLDENHHELLADQAAGRSAVPPGAARGSGVMYTFDLMTLIKTSQFLFSEIEIDRLLKIIMKLFIENAGAEHGYLILKREEDEKLYIEATGKADDEAGAQKPVPLEESSTLAAAIVQFVYKTGENVVLDNAADDSRFITDPYIMQHRPKSILCVPIKCRGSLTGIIYLENNLTTCAFTPARIELLQVLSAQAAISLENSRLVIHRENAVRLKTEMRLAREIQTVLLPAAPAIRGYEITAYMEPADYIGGDYYDVINTGSSDWIIIGDVSGHGMPAGLVMMMVQTSIHTILDQHPAIMPSTLLSRVNRTITRNIKLLSGSRYMTITALVVKDNGLITFAGAHLDILVYRVKTGNVEEIETSGIWIGLEKDITGLLTDRSFSLENGDVMLLYTDGITEAYRKNKAAGERQGDCMFGIEKLAEIFGSLGNNTTEEIQKGILSAVKQDYISSDDISLLAAKRLPSL